MVSEIKVKIDLDGEEGVGTTDNNLDALGVYVV